MIDTPDELQLPALRFRRAQTWRIAASLAERHGWLRPAQPDDGAILLRLEDELGRILVTFDDDGLSYRGEQGHVTIDWFAVFEAPFPDSIVDQVSSGAITAWRQEQDPPDAGSAGRVLLFRVFARLFALAVDDPVSWSVQQEESDWIDWWRLTRGDELMLRLNVSGTSLLDGDRVDLLGHPYFHGNADIVTASLARSLADFTDDGEAPEDGPAGSARADGPGVRESEGRPSNVQVAWVWQRLAGSVSSEPPPLPTDQNPDGDQWPAVCAQWTPLLQLLFFGLGWSDPARGLSRWLNAGWPRTEPVLDLVTTHWGRSGGRMVRDLQGFTAYLQAAESMKETRLLFRVMLKAQRSARGTAPDYFGYLRSTKEWQEVWGHAGVGRDLIGSALEPLHNAKLPVVWTAGPVSGPDAKPHHILVLDRYPGWYRALSELPFDHGGPHGVRVDVHVRPVGWLGTFRRSRTTGLWFRGRHSTHMLGN